MSVREFTVILRPIAENILCPLAENVLCPVAENVLQHIAENVLYPPQRIPEDT